MKDYLFSYQNKPHPYYNKPGIKPKSISEKINSKLILFTIYFLNHPIA